MHYFGIAGSAKRVLVRATKPRPEYVVTTRQSLTFSIFALGERSSNYIAPLISPSGMQLFKQFSPHSCFHRLPRESAEALISAIASAGPKCLVAPIQIEGRYIIEYTGARSSVFPLIARRRVSLRAFGPVSIQDLVSAVILLRRDLRSLQIAPSLRAQESLRRNLAIDPPCKLTVISDQSAPNATLAQMLAIGIETYDSAATEICHCDLQEGNVIIAKDGSVRVVDLDGLAFGTAFTDGICAMIWAGVSPDVVEATVAALESDEGRRVTVGDCGIALIIMARWFQAIVLVQTEEATANVQRARGGLSSLVTWWEHRQSSPVSH